MTENGNDATTSNSGDKRWINYHDQSHGDACSHDTKGQYTYIPCQGTDCLTLLPWPSPFEGEARYFCRRCRPPWQPRTTKADDLDRIFAELLVEQPHNTFLKERIAERARLKAAGVVLDGRQEAEAILGQIAGTMQEVDEAELQRRKREQLIKAMDAGLIAREPGQEG